MSITLVLSCLCPFVGILSVHDPVVRLGLALYGHPDAGGFWERHREEALKSVGFRAVPGLEKPGLEKRVSTSQAQSDARSVC